MANDATLKIEAGINEALGEMEEHREGDILVEWMVLTYVTNPDRAKGDALPVFFSNGSMPSHHAIGMMEQTLFNMKRGQFEDDIDD